jgi:hypothetical protein
MSDEHGIFLSGTSTSDWEPDPDIGGLMHILCSAGRVEVADLHLCPAAPRCGVCAAGSGDRQPRRAAGVNRPDTASCSQIPESLINPDVGGRRVRRRAHQGGRGRPHHRDGARPRDGGILDRQGGQDGGMEAIDSQGVVFAVTAQRPFAADETLIRQLMSRY